MILLLGLDKDFLGVFCVKFLCLFVYFIGDYFGGMGEVDWDGLMMDDRM